MAGNQGSLSRACRRRRPESLFALPDRRGGGGWKNAQDLEDPETVVRSARRRCGSSSPGGCAARARFAAARSGACPDLDGRGQRHRHRLHGRAWCPGATVTLVNEETNIQRACARRTAAATSRSSTSGPGRYALTVELSGFNKAQHRDLHRGRQRDRRAQRHASRSARRRDGRGDGPVRAAPGLHRRARQRGRGEGDPRRAAAGAELHPAPAALSGREPGLHGPGPGQNGPPPRSTASRATPACPGGSSPTPRSRASRTARRSTTWTAS